MSLRHLWLDGPLPEAGCITIDGEIHHRLTHVNRARPGDRFVLRGCDGCAYLGVVRAMGRADLRFEVLEVLPAPPPPKRHITVTQAVVRGDRFDEVLRHGTEIGAAAFHPVITRRTVHRSTEGDSGNRSARWQAIVRSAAEQAQRDRIPPVHPTTILSQRLDELDHDTTAALVLDPRASMSLGAARHKPTIGNADSIALFVGPEGGYCDEEIAQLIDAGVWPVRLGSYILRTEVAAIAALATLLLADD